MLKVLYVQIFVKNTYIQYSMKFGHFLPCLLPCREMSKWKRKNGYLFTFFKACKRQELHFWIEFGMVSLSPQHLSCNSLYLVLKRFSEGT